MKTQVVAKIIGMIVLFQSIVLAATVRGLVKYQRNGNPVSTALVQIRSQMPVYGAMTDHNGRYIIDDVKPGTYAVITIAAGCITRTDTLVIVNSRKTYRMDIKLFEPIINSDPVTEDYHRRLRSENDKHAILTLKITSYEINNGFLTVSTSIRNNSSNNFTIIRPSRTMNYFSAIIRDNRGKLIKPNTVMSDIVGEKIFPTGDDCITIPKQQIIDCPPFKLEFYNFNSFPQSRYTIRLKYRFEKPVSLGVYNFTPDYRDRYKDEINTLNTTLRGEYESSNIITIENEH
jgi:hypothetical protein